MSFLWRQATLSPLQQAPTALRYASAKVRNCFMSPIARLSDLTLMVGSGLPDPSLPRLELNQLICPVVPNNPAVEVLELGFHRALRDR